jgi:hypothetical protein
MSNDDDGEDKVVPKIAFIIRKDDENLTQEQQDQLRKRLEELFNIYAYGKMTQDISGLEPRNKHPVRRSRKVPVEPYKMVACPANNRPPFEE